MVEIPPRKDSNGGGQSRIFTNAPLPCAKLVGRENTNACANNVWESGLVLLSQDKRCLMKGSFGNAAMSVCDRGGTSDPRETTVERVTQILWRH